MDAESRWEARMEWAEERRRGFDIEVNQRHDLDGDFGCDVRHCHQPGKSEVEVKTVGSPGSGTWFVLCADHDENEIALELYGE